MKYNLLTITAIVTTLASCGQSTPHRHHEKQLAPSDIKISALDLNKKQIQMRFEYRSYIAKKFVSIECETILLENQPITLTLNPNISFDSFSTEVLTFNNINSTDLESLKGLKNLDYELDCKVIYDKGREYIQKESTMYPVPKSDYLFR